MMKEGIGMERPKDPGLPEDVFEVLHQPDWLIYYSKTTGSFYVYPASYHPGTLELGKDVLWELLRIINQGEEAAVKDLEWFH